MHNNYLSTPVTGQSTQHTAQHYWFTRTASCSGNVFLGLISASTVQFVDHFKLIHAVALSLFVVNQQSALTGRKLA